MTIIDITARFHGGDDLSTEAFENLRVKGTERDRSRIVDYIRRFGSATCDEAEEALNLSHQTCSARFAELRRDGVLTDSGAKRPTRTGRSARVHVLGEGA